MGKFGVALVAASLLALLAAHPSAGHSEVDYYPERWLTLNQSWFFDDGFPAGNKTSRVRDGLAAWNGRGQTLQFSETAKRDAGFDPSTTCPAAGTNSISWTDISDGVGALAITWTCSFGVEISSTNMVFDSSRSWYDGVGDAPDGFANQIRSLPPGCQYDIWSVAAHEWGHMTGFFGPFADGHRDPSADICQTNDGQQTMCPMIEIGTERLRTLGVHDGHTFDARY